MFKLTSLGLITASALAISIFGLILALPIAALTPASLEKLPQRKPLIGSLFVLICISGILAVFFPDKCSKTFHRRRGGKLVIKETGKGNFHMSHSDFKGHHPDCGRFNAHLLRLNGQIFCAACTGLFIGAVIVLVGAIVYFFASWNFLGQFGFWSITIGQVGVVFSFFQFKFEGFVRSAINVFFVVACFMVLIGVDAFSENLFVDFYVACLIPFIIFTRILLSQWDHAKVCNSCDIMCELKRV